MAAVAHAAAAAVVAGPGDTRTPGVGLPSLSTRAPSGEDRLIPMFRPSDTPDPRKPPMRDTVSVRQAVEHARRKHEDMAADRLLGDGRVGDAELTSLLLVPYPTLAGQRN